GSKFSGSYLDCAALWNSRLQLTGPIPWLERAAKLKSGRRFHFTQKEMSAASLRTPAMRLSCAGRDRGTLSNTPSTVRTGVIKFRAVSKSNSRARSGRRLDGVISNTISTLRVLFINRHGTDRLSRPG